MKMHLPSHHWRVVMYMHTVHTPRGRTVNAVESLMRAGESNLRYTSGSLCEYIVPYRTGTFALHLVSLGAT